MNQETKDLTIVSVDYWSDFAKELVKLATLKPNGKILDIGTGSGACLIAVADKLGEKCHLVGIDKNKAKISQARNNFKNIVVESAQFRTMEASNLKFDDKSFDNILCGFIGFSDSYDFKNNLFIGKNAKMKEIFRVLKSGGEAAFSTWEYQQDIEIARELLQKYLIDKDMKKPDEIENLSISYSKETKEGFKIIMEDAGFTNIKIFSKDFQILYKSFDEWWEVMEYAAWIMRYTLNQNEDKLKDLKKYVSIQGIESFKQKDGYGFQKSVIFAFGSK
ncbi:MAG: methyltransferase domain-containing protein [Candidatus Lokiarchaeota archaeon]|nr:methyltransferase domain-containing protein [Candidatus Lokiarchaeota archaeon]